MVLVRDPQGRCLVHRRPLGCSRFPGQYSWLVAGAVGIGESYEEAAARELLEELGTRAPVRPVFKFRCEGELSPYWFAVHEAVIEPQSVAANGDEIAWHDWLSEEELAEVIHQWPFVSDSRDAHQRYRALQKRLGDAEARKSSDV